MPLQLALEASLTLEIFAEPFEPRWIKLSVEHRVLYILVAEVGLDSSCINAL